MTGGGAARALVPAGGLLVWVAHFGALYALHALACERGLADARLLGLPLLPAAALAATLLALLALFLLARPALAAFADDAAEGSEEEYRFRHWLTVASAGAAAVAILFGTTPALMLPAC